MQTDNRVTVRDVERIKQFQRELSEAHRRVAMQEQALGLHVGPFYTYERLPGNRIIL